MYKTAIYFNLNRRRFWTTILALFAFTQANAFHFPRGFESVSGSAVRYKLDLNGLNVYATNGGLIYQLKGGGQINLRLENANSNATIQAEAPQDFPIVSFVAGAESSGSAKQLYSRIVYREIYPKIDWVIMVGSNGESVKHEFAVRPGGNPDQIRLRYEGATSVRVEKDGSLAVESSSGVLTEAAPVSFQCNGVKDAKQKAVDCRYRLVDAQTVQYALSDYNPAELLVIDPFLTWATYLGGEDDDGITCTEHDKQGNLWVAGWTNTDFVIPGSPSVFGTLVTPVSPFTMGEPLNGNGDNVNVFIIKYKKNFAIEKVFLYGGPNRDNVNDMTFDKLGRLWFVGAIKKLSTESALIGTTYIPIINADVFNPDVASNVNYSVSGGLTDWFIACLDPRLSTPTLVFSTNYGTFADDATHPDYAITVAVDNELSVYVGGSMSLLPAVTASSETPFVRFNSNGSTDDDGAAFVIKLKLNDDQNYYLDRVLSMGKGTSGDEYSCVYLVQVQRVNNEDFVWVGGRMLANRRNKINSAEFSDALLLKFNTDFGFVEDDPQVGCTTDYKCCIDNESACLWRFGFGYAGGNLRWDFFSTITFEANGDFWAAGCLHRETDGSPDYNTVYSNLPNFLTIGDLDNFVDTDIIDDNYNGYSTPANPIAALYPLKSTSAPSPTADNRKIFILYFDRHDDNNYQLKWGEYLGTSGNEVNPDFTEPSKEYCRPGLRLLSTGEKSVVLGASNSFFDTDDDNGLTLGNGSFGYYQLEEQFDGMLVDIKLAEVSSKLNRTTQDFSFYGGCGNENIMDISIMPRSLALNFLGDKSVIAAGYTNSKCGCSGSSAPGLPLMDMDGEATEIAHYEDEGKLNDIGTGTVNDGFVARFSDLYLNGGKANDCYDPPPPTETFASPNYCGCSATPAP